MITPDTTSLEMRDLQPDCEPGTSDLQIYKPSDVIMKDTEFWHCVGPIVLTSFALHEKDTEMSFELHAIKRFLTGNVDDIRDGRSGENAELMETFNICRAHPFGYIVFAESAWYSKRCKKRMLVGLLLVSVENNIISDSHEEGAPTLFVRTFVTRSGWRWRGIEYHMWNDLLKIIKEDPIFKSRRINKLDDDVAVVLECEGPVGTKSYKWADLQAEPQEDMEAEPQ